MVRCPVTGREFSTGIETDRHTLELIPDTVSQSLCPHCGNAHAWTKFDARLHEVGQPASEPLAAHAGNPARRAG